MCFKLFSIRDFLLKPDGFSDQNILRSLEGHEEYREHEKFMFTWDVCKSNENKLSPFSSLQFSCLVMSDSLRPHGPQYARPPCPSPTPGACLNSHPLSKWCHPTISSSVGLFSSSLQSFPSIKVFSNESALRIRWPKYWSFSFSISSSSEHPGLIFRMDWFDLLAVQGTLKSLLHHHS